MEAEPPCPSPPAAFQCWALLQPANSVPLFCYWQNTPKFLIFPVVERLQLPQQPTVRKPGAEPNNAANNPRHFLGVLCCFGFFFVPFFSPRLFSLVKPEGNAALRKPLECQISWEGNAINAAGERHAGNLGKAAPPWCSPAVESQERLGDYGLKRAHLQPDC